MNANNCSMGTWKRPPCALCGVPVEASARTEQPVMFLRDSRRWAHWACWRRARGARTEGERRRGDRGWRSVGQVLEEMYDGWEQLR